MLSLARILLEGLAGIAVALVSLLVDFLMRRAARSQSRPSPLFYDSDESSTSRGLLRRPAFLPSVHDEG